MITQNKRLIVIVSTVVLLLLIPFIAMKFTGEVSWTSYDFVVAVVLLLGTGLMCELVMRKVNMVRHKIIICTILLVVLLLTWIELAVGILGSPFAGS